MNRCLGDRTLWLLSEGESSREARDHVASCAVCAARLRRLEQDLRRLRAVLTGPPPPQVAPTWRPPVRMRWLTAASTLAAMLMVVWVGLRWQQPSPPTFSTQTRQESVWPFIEGLSAALFSTGDIGSISTPDQLSDLDDLQIALAGDWPCAGQAALVNVACDDDPFALLLGAR
jgi:hypothetical protein